MTPLEFTQEFLSNPDRIAWVVVALFLGLAIAEQFSRDRARKLGAVAWATFGYFWALKVPYYAFEMKSVVEGVLSLAAVPLCVYAGYLLYRGRDSLFVLSRAVAFMGVIFMPFNAIPVLRQWIIETVAAQTHWVATALGFDPVLETGPIWGYESQLAFTTDGHRFVTYIEIVCTGVGSIAIFGGLVAAVKAPLRRKLEVLAVVVPLIYLLNVVRNVWIAVAFGKQWMQFFVPEIMGLVGYDQPGLVSFFLADRVLSQLLSVVVLVAIALFVARRLPELFVVVDDVLYMMTGNEYDLADRMRGGGGSGGAGGTSEGGSPATVADGGR
jgi:archaeosortase A (PGF-CTERM-specific)